MPEQCPECGRFLARAFVDGLGAGPGPCPACGTTLEGSMFTGDDAGSIRPPDLEPDEVRDAPDPLAGWDLDVAVPPVRDERPFPLDTVVVAGTGLVGAIGGWLAGDRRGQGGRTALLGALLGVVAAALARRLWRLPDA